MKIIVGRFISSPSRLTATNALGLIFQLGRLNGLPLHVARDVCSTTGQRFDVIHDITWAPVRIPTLHFKLMLGGLAPGDPSMAVSRGARGFVVFGA
jgi:hypothetical protein